MEGRMEQRNEGTKESRVMHASHQAELSVSKTKQVGSRESSALVQPGFALGSA